MKPRLESAEYTAEDTRIHLRHLHTSADVARFGGTLFGFARVQDRRDADLMLRLYKAWHSDRPVKRSTKRRRVRHESLAYVGVTIGVGSQVI